MRNCQSAGLTSGALHLPSFLSFSHRSLPTREAGFLQPLQHTTKPMSLLRRPRNGTLGFLLFTFSRREDGRRLPGRRAGQRWATSERRGTVAIRGSSSLSLLLPLRPHYLKPFKCLCCKPKLTFPASLYPSPFPGHEDHGYHRTPVVKHPGLQRL